jgi:hypothetical protein
VTRGARLKTRFELALKLAKDKNIADETMIGLYIVSCDDILSGARLGDDMLVLFTGPFPNHFATRDILQSDLDPGMFPCRYLAPLTSAP